MQFGSEFQFNLKKMILFTSLFLTFARADDGKISDGVRGDRQCSVQHTRNNFLAESKIYFKGAS